MITQNYTTAALRSNRKETMYYKIQTALNFKGLR